MTGLLIGLGWAGLDWYPFLQRIWDMGTYFLVIPHDFGVLNWFSLATHFRSLLFFLIHFFFFDIRDLAEGLRCFSRRELVFDLVGCALRMAPPTR